MGLLDNLFGGSKKSDNHVAAGKTSGTADVTANAGATINTAATANAHAKANTNAGAATPIDPKQEIHFKFGTREPIPFKDAKTGLALKVRGFGTVSVLVEDTASYKSAEEVMEKGREMASEALERFLQENSGNADFMKLVSRQNEISEVVGGALKQGRWKVMFVKLSGLSMDDESKTAYEKFKQDQMMAANPALAQAMAVAEAADAMREEQAAARRANGEEEKASEDLIIYSGNPLPGQQEIPKAATNPLVIPFGTPNEIRIRDIEFKADLSVRMAGVILIDTTGVPVDNYKGCADCAKSKVLTQLTATVSKICANEPVENLRNHVGDLNAELAKGLAQLSTPIKAEVRIEQIVLPAVSRKLLDDLRRAQELSDPAKMQAAVEEEMQKRGITPEQAAAMQAQGALGAQAAVPVMPQSATPATVQPQAAAYRPKFCPNCGSPTGDSGKFCRNCGTKL